jgi:hypothetical protein
MLANLPFQWQPLTLSLPMERVSSCLSHKVRVAGSLAYWEREG